MFPPIHSDNHSNSSRRNANNASATTNQEDSDYSRLKTIQEYKAQHSLNDIYNFFTNNPKKLTIDLIQTYYEIRSNSSLLSELKRNLLVESIECLHYVRVHEFKMAHQSIYEYTCQVKNGFLLNGELKLSKADAPWILEQLSDCKKTCLLEECEKCRKNKEWEKLYIRQCQYKRFMEQREAGEKISFVDVENDMKKIKETIKNEFLIYMQRRIGNISPIDPVQMKSWYPKSWIDRINEQQAVKDSQKKAMRSIEYIQAPIAEELPMDTTLEVSQNVEDESFLVVGDKTNLSEVAGLNMPPNEERDASFMRRYSTPSATNETCTNQIHMVSSDNISNPVDENSTKLVENINLTQLQLGNTSNKININNKNNNINTIKLTNNTIERSQGKTSNVAVKESTVNSFYPVPPKKEEDSRKKYRPSYFKSFQLLDQMFPTTPKQKKEDEVFEEDRSFRATPTNTVTDQRTVSASSASTTTTVVQREKSHVEYVVDRIQYIKKVVIDQKMEYEVALQNCKNLLLTLNIKEVEKQPSIFVDLYSLTAHVHQKIGDIAHATIFQRKAADVAKKYSVNNQQHQVSLLSDLYMESGQFMAALKIWQSLFQPNSMAYRNQAQVCEKIAECLSRMGKHEDSIKHLLQAMELASKGMFTHKDRCSFLLKIAEENRKAENFDTAISFCEESLEIALREEDLLMQSKILAQLKELQQYIKSSKALDIKLSSNKVQV